MPGNFGGAPISPFVDPNRYIAREWLQWLSQIGNNAASGGTVTGPATSTIGALATWTNTTGTTLGQLTGTGIVKVTANVGGVIALTTAADYLGGDAAFHALPTPIIQGATTTFTDTQIKALPSAAGGFSQLIAAPGTGHRIVPLFTDVKLDNSLGAYGNVNATGSWNIGLQGEFVFSNYVINDPAIPRSSLTTMLTGTGIWNWIFVPYSGAEPVTDWGNIALPQGLVSGGGINLPLGLQVDNNGGGNYTGGNGANTLKITPFYGVVTY